MNWQGFTETYKTCEKECQTWFSENTSDPSVTQSPNIIGS